MSNAADKIPAELAKELRTLAHDLSNALETIVQATYLISQAGPPESSRRWVELNRSSLAGSGENQSEAASDLALAELGSGSSVWAQARA